jgi:hypothetical protein
VSIALRLPPTASISSIKMIAGVFSLAESNRSLILLAPTPTNLKSLKRTISHHLRWTTTSDGSTHISSKSEPEAAKKLTPASPATALARCVFPTPLMTDDDMSLRKLFKTKLTHLVVLSRVYLSEVYPLIDYTLLGSLRIRQTRRVLPLLRHNRERRQKWW